MKKDEAKTIALPCCQVDEVACQSCKYFGQPYCSNIALKDALAQIEELKTTIHLMQIQMQGDCGCCKHQDKEELCADCMRKLLRPHWEYEGLPELPKPSVMPKKGESE